MRVVSIGKSVEELLSAPDAEDNLASSVEFCGGTHLTNTAQVGDKTAECINRRGTQ